MGNPKKPASVHAIKGTYNKSRHGDEPDKIEGMPDKPEWMSAPGIREWDKVADYLYQAGYLAKTDAAALGTYCELMAEFAASPVDFPASKLSQLRMMMQELGLTPSGRVKMPAKPEDKSGNPFEGM